MLDAVGLVWTATILAYAVIAVALIIGRWAFNRITQLLKHEGALLHSAQHQPHSTALAEKQEMAAAL
jgi:hypothetical protein